MMTKLKLIKEVRVGLMIILGVLSIFMIVLGIKTYQTPIVKLQEKEKYEYSNAVNVSYYANLKPNRLYPEATLADQEFYLSEFVKEIVVEFDMLFNSNIEADISGEFEIAMQIQGYEIQRETKNVIWTKAIAEKPMGRFKKKDINHSITRQVSISFESYNEFVAAVIEESKANTEAELVVKLIGNKLITIEGKTKEVPIDTTVYIPLVKKYFAIAKEGTEESEEVVKETLKIEMPPNTDQALFCGVVAFISLLGIGVVLIFTQNPTLEDALVSKRKKLFQEHGSRMVAIDYFEETNYLKSYRVITLDDLVKIADEIEKPVFYKYDRDILKINKFYTIDRNILYSYQVKEEIQRQQAAEIEQTQDMNEQKEQVKREQIQKDISSIHDL